tara:strand:+ start:731 stop:1366 length:636 start_codon:yes stop_codon:yes gene_type:complete
MTLPKPKTTQKRKTTKPRAKAKPKVKTNAETLVTLPPNPFAHEVFELVSKQRSKAKKIEYLKKYEHPSLKALFIWNFDPTVITLLPPGEVPYSSLEEEQNTSGTLTTKINQQTDTMRFNQSQALGSSDNLKQGRTSIRKEYVKFYNFIKGGNDTLKALRRETMFIQILQGLHPLEAQLLFLVKDKKLTDQYNIPQDIVCDAYPDIVWGGRS